MGCASTLAHNASTQSREACNSILKRKEYQYRLPCPSCRVCCRMDRRQLRECMLPVLTSAAAQALVQMCAQTLSPFASQRWPLSACIVLTSSRHEHTNEAEGGQRRKPRGPPATAVPPMWAQGYVGPFLDMGSLPSWVPGVGASYVHASPQLKHKWRQTSKQVHRKKSGNNLRTRECCHSESALMARKHMPVYAEAVTEFVQWCKTSRLPQVGNPPASAFTVVATQWTQCSTSNATALILCYHVDASES